MQPAERSAFKANAALLRGDLDSALHHLHAAVVLAPAAAALHNDIGCVLAKGSAPERAGVSFEQALALDGRHMPTRRNFVRWTAARKGPKRALAILTTDISEAPAAGWIYFEAAVLRAQMDPQTDGGERAIKLHGEAAGLMQLATRLCFAEALRVQSQSSAFRGDALRAVWFAQRAVQCHPQDADALSFLAASMQHVGNARAAFGVLEAEVLRRTSRSPQLSDLRVLRHAVHIAREASVPISAEFERAARSTLLDGALPTHVPIADLAFNLGGLFSDAGRAEVAVTYLKIARRELPYNPMYVGCLRHYMAASAMWADPEFPSISDVVSSIDGLPFTDADIPPLMYVLPLPVELSVLLHVARSNADSHIRGRSVGMPHMPLTWRLLPRNRCDPLQHVNLCKHIWVRTHRFAHGRVVCCADCGRACRLYTVTCAKG